MKQRNKKRIGVLALLLAAALAIFSALALRGGDMPIQQGNFKDVAQYCSLVIDCFLGISFG